LIREKRGNTMSEEQDEFKENLTNDHQNQLEEESKIESESETLDKSELDNNMDGVEEDLIEAPSDIESTEEDKGEILAQEVETEEVEKDLRTIQKNLIEGALYAAGSPLDIEEIATKLELSKKLVEELIKEVAYEYLERSSALIIAQVGERFQMQLRPEYTETVSKFAKGGAIAEKYLRTLTIIALKQPILKSTVIKLRGTGAYEHVKYLLDNELISAEKKGRSHELTTTDKYADMFGLPKNREELKRTMISQLGLDEIK
jgi:segregation and condensation protein B